MPAPAAGTPRTILPKLAIDSLKTMIQLEQAIGSRTPELSGQPRGKIIWSQPPWNAAVAVVVFEFHQLARTQEASFRRSAGQPVRPRGGSDKNTQLAIESICRLASAVTDDVVVLAVRDLDRWLGHAKTVLGELEHPQRLPRLPGQTEPACPFCGHRTLRMFPLRGVVVCVMPLELCHDAEKRKPRAQMEYSKFTKQFELVWQDSVVGIPAA